MRKDSFNTKLVRAAARGASAEGADVTVVELRSYPLPVFSEDLEASEGTPAAAVEIKELLKSHDAFLIASPEYNGSLTAALKNVIDWSSRKAPGEAPLACWRGKTAGLLATSPGALGGLRGLAHLRTILSGIGVMVIPDQRAMGGAMEAFDSEGRLIDEKERAAIEAIGAEVARTACLLNDGR